MDKKLYLSRNNKVLAGVCGGIGEYFNVDPTLIRIIFVLMLFVSRFLFVLLYIILWAVIPLSERE